MIVGNYLDFLAYESEADAAPPSPEVPQQPVDECFLHSDDFRIVTLHGRRFELTELQAMVVKRLYEASRSNDTCIGSKLLLAGVSEANEPKISNVFRSLPNWRDLIDPSKRRGFYRLKL